MLQAHCVSLAEASKCFKQQAEGVPLFQIRLLQIVSCAMSHLSNCLLSDCGLGCAGALLLFAKCFFEYANPQFKNI